MGLKKMGGQEWLIVPVHDDGGPTAIGKGRVLPISVVEGIGRQDERFIPKIGAQVQEDLARAVLALGLIEDVIGFRKDPASMELLGLETWRW